MMGLCCCLNGTLKQGLLLIVSGPAVEFRPAQHAHQGNYQAEGSLSSIPDCKQEAQYARNSLTVQTMQAIIRLSDQLYYAWQASLTATVERPTILNRQMTAAMLCRCQAGHRIQDLRPL